MYKKNKIATSLLCFCLVIAALGIIHKYKYQIKKIVIKAAVLVKHKLTRVSEPVRYNAVVPDHWSSPAIFFSDLTAGPNTGGQNNNGVFVTIWGNNFGSTQGTSTITVGGGAVASYETWTNTEITFQLGPDAATGNITLATSNGSATGPLFAVRPGNIYFVDPKAMANGSGNYESPFNHLYYFENIAEPGDTVYVMPGTINDEINGQEGWHAMLIPERAGTPGSPIAWIAYPNAIVNLECDGNTAAWTRGNAGGNDNVAYIFRSTGNVNDWQTISKFTIIETGTSTVSAISSSGSDGWKIVGNNITAQNNPNNGLVSIGGDYTEVLGNEIHNTDLAALNNEAHSIYWNGGGSDVEIGWNYMHDNNNVGWEIQTYHAGTRNGKIHDNLIVNTGSNIDRGINIGDVDGGEDRTGPENSVYDIYNNILVNTGDGLWHGAMALTDGTAHVYNNTIYKDNGVKNGVIAVTSGYGPGGGHPVWYFADNIIISTSSIPYISEGNGNTPNPAYFALMTNNEYDGNGKGPSIDASPINAKPSFINPGTDFHLKSTSRAINAGYNTSSIVATDFDGNARPPNAISIGAFQYVGSSSSKDKISVFTLSSLDRIFQDGKTLLKPTFSNTASISSAKNEYQSFQVVVQTHSKKLNNVELKTSDLLNVGTGTKIASDNISVRVVGYVPTSEPYYQVKYVGLWPDPLLPVHKANIKANSTQPFWVTIYTPSDTMAGDYTGSITVTTDNKILQTVPVFIHIFNFVLPKTSHLKTAFDLYKKYTMIKYPKSNLETNTAYKARINRLNDRYLTTMLNYRMDPILNIDPTSQTQLADIDRYLVYGLNNFAIGKRGGSFGNNWPKTDDGIEKLLPIYQGYGEDLKLNQMLEYTYIYTWDEGDIGNPQVAKIASMVHRAYPGLKNMVTYHGIWDPDILPDWGKDIDIWCFNIDNFDEAKLHRLQKMGKEVWMYVSGPSGNNMPNLAIDFDSIDYRIIPWLCWKYDIKGFLYWCVNDWHLVDPFKNTKNTKWAQNGNGLLFYPGKNGPIESIRMELFREGMQDYEYIQLLFEDLKILKSKNLDKQYQAYFNDSVKLLTMDDSIAASMSNFTKDGELLNKRRNAIAQKIEEFNSMAKYLGIIF